jgi:hypothetical protein
MVSLQRGAAVFDTATETEKMKRKPVVWYVDDLPENLQKFKEVHEPAFSIRLFTRPSDVLNALGEERPDALLCDVFYYEPEEKAREMERKVQEKACELRRFGAAIGASSSENRFCARICMEPHFRLLS